MKLFTVIGGTLTAGAKIQTLELKSGIKIPVLQVGEHGRGRKQDSIPVALYGQNMKDWEAGKPVTIYFAKLGETRAGKPKLIEAMETHDNDACVVFRTGIGFRGGNRHTGDYNPEWKPYVRPEGTNPIAAEREESQHNATQFGAWPGNNIAAGYIAQGIAGNMGGGDQYITIMPKDSIWRIRETGRTYGRDCEWFYRYDGYTIECVTPEQREIADLW